MTKYIAPSILSADFVNLEQEIKAVSAAGADWLHVDVMDGHFVPNITLGPVVVQAIRQVTSLPMDVHLMIENPESYIDAFVQAGADLISVHIESTNHCNRAIQMIRQAGVRPGVVLNPSTPLSTLEWTLELIDFVVLMSVNPGFGGQKFIENTYPKIEALRTMLQKRNLNVMIQVDGGINAKTITRASKAGADVFVAGSAVFQSSNYEHTIQDLKQKMSQGE